MELTRVNVLPKICSTFSICPIPLRYDTYSGCSFGCCYCFARPTVEHNRIKTDSDFSSLRGSNPTYLSKWLEKTINTDTAFTTPHRCAIQARFPIKIGVMADPFPCVEQTEHITYDTLKIFNAYDYPIQISTKNPELLSTYYQDFNNPNWVISVSLCSLDSDHLKQIEPNAPTLQSRLDGISKLTDMGASVFLRWQPFIFPYGLQFVEDYVDLAAKLNCKGIILESLKFSNALSISYRQQLQAMNNVLGYDIIKWYRENGTLKDMDCMLKQEDKLDYIRKIKAHGNEKGVSVYVGENETVCRQQSCHGECCGTHLLRNHNVMANAHTDACRLPNRSHALDDCKVGMRSTRFKGKTIREIITLKSLH